MRLVQVSYSVIYGINMTKKTRESISQVASCLRNKNLFMKVVNVKRQICSVLAVKKVVYSTLIVSIFLTNILDIHFNSLLSECFKVWSWTSSLLSSSFKTWLSTCTKPNHFYCQVILPVKCQSRAMFCLTTKDLWQFYTWSLQI